MKHEDLMVLNQTVKMNAFISQALVCLLANQTIGLFGHLHSCPYFSQSIILKVVLCLRPGGRTSTLVSLLLKILILHTVIWNQRLLSN